MSAAVAAAESDVGFKAGLGRFKGALADSYSTAQGRSPRKHDSYNMYVWFMTGWTSSPGTQ